MKDDANFNLATLCLCSCNITDIHTFIVFFPLLLMFELNKPVLSVGFQPSFDKEEKILYIFLSKFLKGATKTSKLLKIRLTVVLETLTVLSNLTKSFKSLEHPFDLNSFSGYFQQWFVNYIPANLRQILIPECLRVVDIQIKFSKYSTIFWRCNSLNSAIFVYDWELIRGLSIIDTPLISEPIDLCSFTVIWLSTRSISNEWKLTCTENK